MCIPEPKGDLPRTMPPVPGCKSAPGVPVSGGMRATMHCAFGDTTITTRRLNKTTWQFESQTVVKQSQAGRGDAVSPMRAMLEAMMEKGSPEEKREATAQLANLPKMEAQMAGVQRQRAAMAPQMAQARGRGRTRRLLRQRQAGVGERRQIHDHPDRRQVRRLMPRAGHQHQGTA
ncbi:hypothetical protein LP420_11755 [Massilia sp. B-10]|nr:hypothetical protein LP420_11755 [Massilia sp. B-10]